MANKTEKTVLEKETSRKPQKKYYRQRAHTNPLADHSFEYPVKPTAWKDECDKLYDTSGFSNTNCSRKVTFAEIQPNHT